MDVLKRDVNITGDFAAVGDCLDQLVTPMRRMRIKQPHPEIAVDLLNLSQEINQRRSAGGINRLARSGFLAPQIHSVISRVLADQIEFAHALRDESANFRED